MAGAGIEVTTREATQRGGWHRSPGGRAGIRMILVLDFIVGSLCGRSELTPNRNAFSERVVPVAGAGIAIRSTRVSRVPADVTGDNPGIATDSSDQSAGAHRVRVIMRKAACVRVCDKIHVERGGNIPASLENILIHNDLVHAAATVLRNAENDVGRAIEPGRPGPPRPNSQALQLRHMGQHLDELFT